MSSFQLESRPGELLHDHLRAVAGSAQQIFNNVNDKITTRIQLSDLRKIAYWMGATHDIGKGTRYFQDYLNHIQSSDPDFQLLKSHSYISSLYCSWIIQNSNIPSDVKDFLQTSAALGLQGHHGSLKFPNTYLDRLTDFFNKKIFERQINSFVVNELEAISQSLGLPSFRDFSQNWEDAFTDLGRKLMNMDQILNNFPIQNEPYFITNLLFSILLDADRMNAAQITPRRIGVNHNSASQFAQTITGQGAIFDLRRELFRRCNQ